MEVTEYLAKDKDEKIQFISSTEFISEGNEEIYITILQEEKDNELLERIAEAIINRGVIDVQPFIEQISVVEKRKQFIFLEIIIKKIDSTKEQDIRESRIEKIVATLKSLDEQFLIAYTISLDNWGRIFSKETVYNIFGDRDEIQLLSFSQETTKEVIDNVLWLLKHVEQYDPVYSELLEHFNEFIDVPRITHHNIREFLKNLLLVYKFPAKNDFFSLYSKFSSVEELLLTSISGYRDHVTHSFRVFLLGLPLLVIDKEVSINRKFYGQNRLLEWDDFFCWLLTAFYYDIGYGIEKNVDKKWEKNQQ
ncbi:MAG: hypothetical protein ACXAEU_01465 [Candidatus Hodarchaeales archaeon]|jgi:hypothetical protein